MNFLSFLREGGTPMTKGKESVFAAAKGEAILAEVFHRFCDPVNMAVTFPALALRGINQERPL